MNLIYRQMNDIVVNNHVYLMFLIATDHVLPCL